MPVFTKIPVQVTAEQWIGQLANEPKGVCRCWEGECVPHLHTIHNNQMVRLEHGDWILPEPDGVHFYPCKPEIFAKTYQPARAPFAVSAEDLDQEYPMEPGSVTFMPELTMREMARASEAMTGVTPEMKGEAARLAEAVRMMGATFTAKAAQPIARAEPAVSGEWPDPTPEMLDRDPLFDGIWAAIKSWDINVPDVYAGYCGATGNHARAIYDRITGRVTDDPR